MYQYHEFIAEYLLLPVDSILDQIVIDKIHIILISI
jgi:hypothetical protein